MTDINKPGKNLQVLAMVALIIGASGSLALLFNVGSKLVILMILFTFWVISPIAGFLTLHLMSKRWTRKIHLWLYWIIIALSVISLAAYTVVLTRTHLKPASVFLVIPFFSWLFILIFFLIANRLSKKTKA